MKTITYAVISKRKSLLNHVCKAILTQQIKQNKIQDSQFRTRRRHLAKHVLKRLPLTSRTSSQRWLHAVLMMLAAWGFVGLAAPDQAFAAADFSGDNPLAGVHVNMVSTPTFADIDGDGDLDVFVGNYGGTVEYYRNTEIDPGPNVGFVADAGGNPLPALSQIYGNSALVFADVDGDGDLDAFIGTYSGTVKYYRNTEVDAGPNVGFVADAGGNPLSAISLGNYQYPKPAFADIDGDGDLDAFVGEYNGNILYYRNTAIDAGPDVGFVADAGGNPLAAAASTGNTAPFFVDFDGDTDLDVFVGDAWGQVKYFRNTAIDPDVPGTGMVADIAGNPLAGFNVGFNASPGFADVDGDGDLDAFVGNKVGSIKYYRNTEIDAVAPGSGFIAAVGHNNPLAGVGSTQLKPAFADLDGDGDLDAFIGRESGDIKYYRNTEIDAGANVGFVADLAGNPLTGLLVANAYKAPAFADLDADGDLDAFVGVEMGTITYLRNTAIDLSVPGTGFVTDVGGNPFASFDVGSNATPAFADIDDDGDLDAFIGNDYGEIFYYRNTEIDEMSPGTGFLSDVVTNPLSGVSILGLAAPSFADLDLDGDLDAFIGGKRSGGVKYYRNTVNDPSVPGTGFVADVEGNPLRGVGVGSNSAPSFADIDGDGDLDAFIGSNNIGVRYYENFDPAPFPVEDILLANTDIAVIVDVVANDKFKSGGPPAGDFTISAFDASSKKSGTVVYNGDNTFTYTSATSFIGKDWFTYTLDNGAGLKAVGRVAITVTDITAPAVSIDSPVAVNIANQYSYTISGTCTVGDSDVSVDISGFGSYSIPCSGAGTWSKTMDFSGAADGNAAISVGSSQTDISANEGTANVNIDKDTIRPAPAINFSIAPSVNAFNQSNYELSGSCSVGDGDVTVSIAGLANQLASCSVTGDWSAVFDTSGLADGIAAVMASISQTDAAGNTGEDSVVVSKDSVAPLVTITTPEVVNAGNETNYTISGTCSMGDGTVIVQIAGLPSQQIACSNTGTWTAVFDTTGIADGSTAIAINVDQFDNAGNLGAAAAIIAKDTSVSLSPEPDGMVSDGGTTTTTDGTVTDTTTGDGTTGDTATTGDTTTGGGGKKGGGSLGIWTLLMFPIWAVLRRRKRQTQYQAVGFIKRNPS